MTHRFCCAPLSLSSHSEFTQDRLKLRQARTLAIFFLHQCHASLPSMVDLQKLDNHLACIPWHTLLGIDSAYLNDEQSHSPSSADVSALPASNHQIAQHQQEGQHPDIDLISFVQSHPTSQVGTVTVPAPDAAHLALHHSHHRAPTSGFGHATGCKRD